MMRSIVLSLVLAQLGIFGVAGFAPTSSVVSQKQGASRLVAFLETREKTEKDVQSTFLGNQRNIDPVPSNDEDPNKPGLPENALAIAAAIIGTAAVASQAGAYSDFFQSLSQMKENVADPADFWPAVNFWIFFAVGHAILQPIFWISEVLHSSPGPMVGNLVPITFILGNVVAIAAFALSKEVRMHYEGINL
jgi:hypothetical protein